MWWQLFRVRLWPAAQGYFFILILMRLKRLCWHGSPHHQIHVFMCNCTFCFPPFPAFDACVKVFCSCGKSMRPLKHNFLFLLLFILSGSLCVGEKTMTQGLFCFFSLALEVFWYYLHDGKVYVCVWVSWMARVIVQVRKKNTTQDLTLPRCWWWQSHLQCN